MKELKFGDHVKINDDNSFYNGLLGNVIGCKWGHLGTKTISIYTILLKQFGEKVEIKDVCLELTPE